MDPIRPREHHPRRCVYNKLSAEQVAWGSCGEIVQNQGVRCPEDKNKEGPIGLSNKKLLGQFQGFIYNCLKLALYSSIECCLFRLDVLECFKVEHTGGISLKEDWDQCHKIEDRIEQKHVALPNKQQQKIRFNYLRKLIESVTSHTF